MSDFVVRHRILAREERESLSPEAVKCIYETIVGGYCSSDTIEKTLLQAVILSRMGQCCVDADTISFLLEKISEFEDISLGVAENGGESAAYRYC